MEAQAESDGLRDSATQMDQETKVEPGYRRTESTEVKPEVRRSPMQLQGWKNEEQPKVWKSLAMTDQGGAGGTREPGGPGRQWSQLELKGQGGANWLMGQGGAEQTVLTSRGRRGSWAGTGGERGPRVGRVTFVSQSISHTSSSS